MEEEIIRKLRNFLNIRIPMTKEWHAVYLMVEIGKLIEKFGRKIKESYPFLLFHCNWVVHTSKDYNNEALDKIMEIVDKKYNEFKNDPKKRISSFIQDSFLDFVSFGKLKVEMKRFFKELSLPSNFFQENNWKTFKDLLVQILADQPIQYKAKNIKITFKSFMKNKSIIIVRLKDGREFKITHNYDY